MKRPGSALIIVVVIISFLTLGTWLLMHQLSFAHDVALQRALFARNRCAANALLFYGIAGAKKIWDETKNIPSQTVTISAWPTPKSKLNGRIEMEKKGDKSAVIKAHLVDGGQRVCSATCTLNKDAKEYVVRDWQDVLF